MAAVMPSDPKRFNDQAPESPRAAKLRHIYTFLENHQQWNAQFREREFLQYFCHCDTARTRLRALLFSIVNTQQRPDIDTLALFWEDFEQFPWDEKGIRINELVTFFRACPTYDPEDRLREKEPRGAQLPWESLFWAVRKNRGWGPKTAALLVKCIIFLHRAPNTRFHFLSDFAQYSIENDTLYLPVDAVIEHIFRIYVPDSSARASFWEINRYIADAGYTAEDMLLWDDLWYWGYLTQRTNKGHRTMEWNAAKFWSMQSFPKNSIDAVRDLSEQFIAVLEPVIE